MKLENGFGKEMSPEAAQDATDARVALGAWNDQPYDKRSAVDVLGLTSSNCHWPVRDKTADGPALFCGKPSLTGKPYCLRHFNISVPKELRK